jgi:acyl carrier protein
MAASGNQPGLRMSQDGIYGIKLQEGLSVLFSCLQNDLANPTVLDTDWSRFLEVIPTSSADTYFGILKAGQRASAATSTEHDESDETGPRISQLQQIKEATPEERPPLAIALIRKVAARVMGYEDVVQVPTDLSLNRMGLDSLMTMDFRNQLEKRLAITLPFGLLSEQPTLEDIGAHILNQIEP